jgi:hypothetical protein
VTMFLLFILPKAHQESGSMTLLGCSGSFTQDQVCFQVLWLAFHVLMCLVDLIE